MILTLLYFIFALVILIIVHEFGHFIVARLCGVKVLRFSFGFGKVLFSWRSRTGTEFAWSLIPLGGYVKMLDETEGDVPENERHLAFNTQPVLARIAIILAGPVFNLLFAVLALWAMWMIGIKTLAPMIEDVRPGSVAAKAGLKPQQEVIAFAGKDIVSWHDFQFALMPFIGSNEPMPITVRSLTNNQQSNVVLSLDNWNLDAKKPDVLDSLGIVPFIPKVPPVVGEVVSDSPAEAAGLKPGDEIKTLNSEPVSDWLMLVDYVKAHPNGDMTLVLQRQGKEISLKARIGQTVTGGRTEGFLGTRSKRVDWPANWLRVQRETPLRALGLAFEQTAELTGVTLTLIGRLALGKLPIQSLSGPVGIAQSAGESGRSGIAYYLSFLALVSISLGVLNLLPIPVLDGGHLLYCVIELIRRRPLSEEVKSVGVYLGLVLLLALMVIALKNDISRLIG
jgi:regulator of sigma E protease